MKEFFLILFFAKSVLLTPNGVTLTNEWLQIPLEESLEAITSGAAIYVDVSKYVDADASIDNLDAAFPVGTVKVRLVQNDGQETLLGNSSAYSFEKDKIYLNLDATDGVPTGKEFTGLYIQSAKPLSGVSLVWVNHRR
jgi:hypothetical protein